MSQVKLHGSYGSPYVRRVELVLKLKGVEYEYIEEDLVNKSPLILKYNPINQKVPVLLHNEKPILESLVIVEYIDETWKGNNILPQDPYDKAMARFWANFINDKCQPPMWNSIWSKGEEQEKAKKEAGEVLTILENELKGKKFFGGDKIGLADISGNFIAFWSGILEEMSGVTLITEDIYPNLCRWIAEYLNCSIVQESLPDRGILFSYFQTRFQSTGKFSYSNVH
ncbi:hypothetical protein Leryth_000050 [Lithospermum erythrorhizon]|nr:hypothetical protein Leryth_000050 [Lithospermum erythrorhizon]